MNYIELSTKPINQEEEKDEEENRQKDFFSLSYLLTQTISL